MLPHDAADAAIKAPSRCAVLDNAAAQAEAEMAHLHFARRAAMVEATVDDETRADTAA